MPTSYYRSIGADTFVVGKVQEVGGGRYQVSFKLLETAKDGAPLLSKQYVVPQSELSSVAHHISDLIYREIIGVRGVFSTKLAYIVVQCSQVKAAQYTLEVA